MLRDELRFMLLKYLPDVRRTQAYFMETLSANNEDFPTAYGFTLKNTFYICHSLNFSLQKSKMYQLLTPIESLISLLCFKTLV